LHAAATKNTQNHPSDTLMDTITKKTPANIVHGASSLLSNLTSSVVRGAGEVGKRMVKEVSAMGRDLSKLRHIPGDIAHAFATPTHNTAAPMADTHRMVTHPDGTNTRVEDTRRGQHGRRRHDNDDDDDDDS